MSATLISNNTTIKFSGTQVAASSVATNPNLYTVPSGKTLVGSWAINNSSGQVTLKVNSTSIADIITSGAVLSGPLYVNGGSVISTFHNTGGTISIHGVLMENTP